jgi:patatin-like phospholipase/acyl hydrolase
MRKILSIDGGGIRGIIPSLVLDYLEVQSGKPIADLFDLCVGTSSGRYHDPWAGAAR